MRAAADFQSVMRRGHKSGRKTVVVYFGSPLEGSSRAGLAVSRAVGNAVVRNRIKRRLRAILAGLVPALPSHSGVVVRALPAAASASFDKLRDDVATALSAAQAKGAA